METGYTHLNRSTRCFFNLLRLVLCLGCEVLSLIVGCQRPTETDRMLGESNILLEGVILFHGQPLSR